MPSENLSSAVKQIYSNTATYAKNQAISAGQRKVSNSTGGIINVSSSGSVSANYQSLGNKIGSVNFRSNPSVSSQSTTSGLSGITEVSPFIPDNTDIPDQYKIIITSKVGSVTAQLQDKFKYRITSDWEPFLSPTGISNIAAGLFQLATKKSIVNRHTSRRIWKGTSPIGIMLELKFEAFNDAKSEVTDKCRILQKMNLPSTGNTEDSKFGFIPTLYPPGPSPFNVDELQYFNNAPSGIKDYIAGSDKISVQIGKLVKFDSVVIKEIEVEESERMTRAGHPISAVVNIVFDTYEIMTKEALDRAYSLGGGYSE